ncbi:alpha/beta hydrolase [Algoriphagus halophytocola]|uniref:Alpha/beta hydrolase n=1 Tax=Algoriphagus halophytocola TaxID=2991499 RepID=A0ABY6MEF1_9BACT|nr:MULTISPECIES: alpha/beta hydrolase [unclassified Algoriphagus]UZD22175.1 alpha/beta hydrolase [Algoriphagus sp. TR-M5]WBL43426.1 alpha/beta hydrolase [Algoriphagus sp. TR-M9]
MPFLEVNETRLYYEDTELGDEVIVFSHGLLWSQHMFREQVEFLKTRFRVIAYDHRGQGQSQVKQPFDMDTLTEDAVELIRSLTDKPVHFAGLSMGGFIGMRLAARHPELIKSLILMETSANAEPVENLPKYTTLTKIVKWFGVLPLVANKVMPIMFAESWLHDPLNRDKVDYWKKQLRLNAKTIVGPVEGVIRRKGIEDELAMIKCPTLIIVGDEDVATRPEKSKFIQMGIRHARLHVIPGAGHSSCIEKPKAINHLLGDWLIEKS